MLLLLQVLRVTPALTELRLPQCPRITGAAVEQLPSLVPELRLGMLPSPVPPCTNATCSWMLMEHRCVRLVLACVSPWSLLRAEGGTQLRRPGHSVIIHML